MKMLVGALSVGALIAVSAFMQAADAQQFRKPRPDDPERLRMIRECMDMKGNTTLIRSVGPAARSICITPAWPNMATIISSRVIGGCDGAGPL